jgi:thiol-disulfide isomerase/thioredoxin
MQISKITLLFFVAAFASPDMYAQQDVLIKGTVHNRNNKSFYLVPVTKDTRNENKIEIPINNGTFEYRLSSKQVEAFQLIYREELEEGAWQPVIFFTDTSVVNFDLYPPDNFDDNKINGGSANRDYYGLNRKQKQIFKQRQNELGAQESQLKDKGLFYTTEFENIMAKIRNTNSQDERQGYYEERSILEKNGGDLSPKGRSWRRSYDSLRQAITTWKYKQMNNNTSVAYLYVMLNDLRYYAKENAFIANTILETFPKYKAAYAQHPYTTVVNDGLTAIVQLYPGKPFVDVSAPDLNGQKYQLSDLLKNKVALIDLWGSWCGPCIAKSRKVVPLYEKYKGQGFIVVGIAREFGNTDELKKRLAKEKFNWKQLVDLDDRLGIWNKYGIPNAGGMVVLVNRDGKILAVDPTTEELEKQLAAVMKD